MVSEMFENDDGRTKEWMADRWVTESFVYYKLTHDASAQVS